MTEFQILACNGTIQKMLRMAGFGDNIGSVFSKIIKARSTFIDLNFFEIFVQEVWRIGVYLLLLRHGGKKPITADSYHTV